jgi:hypothetical protein
MAGRRCSWRLRIQNGRSEMVQTLFGYAAINDALHWAVQKGHNSLLLTLLANNAAVNEKDEDGWTGAVLGLGKVEFSFCKHSRGGASASI